MKRRAVLLMAYGSPSSMDDLEPYLLDVRDGRPPPPALVEEMRRRYTLIGGSPLNRITAEQAQALQAELARRGRNWPVYVGMRHGSPRIREAVAGLQRDGVTDAAALVLAPHCSSLSIGRYRKRLEEAQAAAGGGIRFQVVNSWWRQPRMIEAMERRVRDAWQRISARPAGRMRVVFTAHSLPARIRAEGDPYEEELLANARTLAERLELTDWMLAFQSAGAGPEPWLGPTIEEVIPRLARDGYRQVLVAPIGFVCDHVEILYDLDVEARRVAEKHGLRLERTESMNTYPPFIAAVADAVEDRMKSAEVGP
jgi:ferrochelatase